MPRRIKTLVLRFLRLAGVNAILLASPWRRRRILILCYHGISLDDEHRWSGLYMPPNALRHRLESVKRSGCTVLGLDEAVTRLYEGSLPPRAVAITFDDGFYDFYAAAWPILKEYNWPVTLYLTTYYSHYNVPVFDPMCSYLLWKAEGRQFQWPELRLGPVHLDQEGRDATASRMIAYSLAERLSGHQKNELLRELASRLGVDFEALCARRVLHLMTPGEAAELAAGGLDLQMHTHRHRVYRSQTRFEREIEENGAAVRELSGKSPRHFCYPGGYYLPEFVPWLRALGVRSATTCEADLASPQSSPYLLPRLVDMPSVGDDAFSAWLSGLCHFFPRRRTPPNPSQLVE